IRTSALCPDQWTSVRANLSRYSVLARSIPLLTRLFAASAPRLCGTVTTIDLSMMRLRGTPCGSSSAIWKEEGAPPHRTACRRRPIGPSSSRVGPREERVCSTLDCRLRVSRVCAKRGERRVLMTGNLAICLVTITKPTACTPAALSATAPRCQRRQTRQIGRWFHPDRSPFPVQVLCSPPKRQGFFPIERALGEASRRAHPAKIEHWRK